MQEVSHLAGTLFLIPQRTFEGPEIGMLKEWKQRTAGRSTLHPTAPAQHRKKDSSASQTQNLTISAAEITTNYIT